MSLSCSHRPSGEPLWALLLLKSCFVAVSILKWKSGWGRASWKHQGCGHVPKESSGTARGPWEVFHSCRGRAFSSRWVSNRECPKQNMDAGWGGQYAAKLPCTWYLLCMQHQNCCSMEHTWEIISGYFSRNWYQGNYVQKTETCHGPPAPPTLTQLQLSVLARLIRRFCMSFSVPVASLCLWHLQAPFLLESQQPMLAGHSLTDLNLFICTWLFRIFIFPAPFFALVLWWW